jgi:hypothetical protein
MIEDVVKSQVPASSVGGDAEFEQSHNQIDIDHFLGL